jgi:pyrimidine operon attenuation protein/uracil phosphoribosyltransferase
MNQVSKSLIISEKQIEAVLNRLAAQIRELRHFHPNLLVIGVQPRGIHLASRLCQLSNERSGPVVQPGKLDPTFFRDDFRSGKKLLVPAEADLPADLEDKPVLLIDDVIFTGRTTRAAIDALLNHGRPAWIKLMVLVNRHLEREIPIAVDFEGFRLDLDSSQKIELHLSDIPGKSRLTITDYEQL